MQCLKKLVFHRAKNMLLPESYSKNKVTSRLFQNTIQILEETHERSENEVKQVAAVENSNVINVINRLNEGVEGKWKLTRKNFEFDDNLQGLEPILPGPLDECREDISHVGPYWKSSFNFASYVDRSTSLQKLVELGVSLFDIEQTDKDPSFLLKLDFEKDIRPYVMFLFDCGVKEEDFSRFLTKNPRFLLEHLDDLKTRIRYLRAHGFSMNMISHIVSSVPKWLNHSTEDIDGRLGNLQALFKLRGKEVRLVAAKCPRIVLLDKFELNEKFYAVKEEMGFEDCDVKHMLLEKPSLYLESRHRLVTTFDYLHNVMKIPHSLILKIPGVLQCRRRKIQPRHQFLVELKRAQYDPLKPLYVSPLSLVEGNDAEFCLNVARVSVETYNLYLKSL